MRRAWAAKSASVTGVESGLEMALEPAPWLWFRDERTVLVRREARWTANSAIRRS